MNFPCTNQLHIIHLLSNNKLFRHNDHTINQPYTSLNREHYQTYTTPLVYLPTLCNNEKNIENFQSFFTTKK